MNFRINPYRISRRIPEVIAGGIIPEENPEGILEGILEAIPGVFFEINPGGIYPKVQKESLK